MLRDAGLGQIDDPNILDFDFAEQLGLGSIELADLFIRVGRAYAVELPSDEIGMFRRPRDLLDAVEKALGAAAFTRHPIERPVAAPEQDASIASLAAMEPAPMSLLDALRTRAEQHSQFPHLKFLTADKQVSTLTFGELWDQGRCVAAGLTNLGLTWGERVAIVMPTGPDFFVAFVGVLCAGGVPVPIYPPLRLDDLGNYVDRQSRILQSATTAFVISDPQFKSAADLLCTATPSLRESVTLASLRGSGTAPFCVTTPPDLALIQYTSGSTGDPKGVALTHGNLLANMRANSDGITRAGCSPSDVVVSWVPLYHDFGLIAMWMSVGIFTGATIVLMSPIDFLTKPALWLWAIDRFRATTAPTTTFGLDHVRRRVLDQDIARIELSSLKAVVIGAEPVRPKAIDEFCCRFENYGFRRGAVAPAYGLAESCVGVTFAGGEQRPRVDHVDADRLADEGRALPAGQGSRIRSLVSCGTPMGDQQIRIVESTDRLTPLAERLEGRVLVRGKSVMSGYFGRPDATAAVLLGDWLDTGDLGYLADGELFITGRVKDLIIKAGRNYHPQDIEHAVGELPGVRKGCVIAFGEPTDQGEGLVVVAETTTDRAKYDEIKALIRAAVVEATGTSADDVVLISRGSILKTSSGKLRRQETRLAYRDGTLGRRASRRGVVLLVARLARYRVRTFIGRRRDELVGSYIATATMAVVLVSAGASALLRSRTATWRFTRRMLRVLFATTGMSFRRTGVPLPDGQAIYVSNHPTDMDPLLLLSAFDRPVCMTAKARLLQGPLGLLARRLGVIPVEPGSLEASLTSYERLELLLAQGESIHIFPEGERRDTPGTYPFRLGAFKLAAAAGIPIVPLALRGPREVMRGRPYRPAALEVQVLPAVRLDCPASDLAALAAARAQVRQVIAEASGEPLVSNPSLKKPVVRDSVATRFSSWGARARR